MPWITSYYVPPSSIVTTVCSGTISLTGMLDYAALAVVFAVICVAVPSMAGDLVGGTVGFALAHAFEAAYTAQTIARIVNPITASLRKVSESVAGLGRGRDGGSGDPVRTAMQDILTRHHAKRVSTRAGSPRPLCSIRLMGGGPATTCAGPTAPPRRAQQARARLATQRPRVRSPRTSLYRPTVTATHEFYSADLDGGAVAAEWGEEAVQASAINQFDGIAPAPLNSTAPFLRTRCAMLRRNCKAPRALVDGVTPLRSNPFPPRRSVMGEAAAGERCLRFISDRGTPCRRSGGRRSKEVHHG